MSGFFRGPPLLVYVIVLAIIEAVLIPLTYDYTDSPGITVLIAVGVFGLYALLAIVWSSRKPKPNPPEEDA
jgi:hypothetical protein